MTLLSCAQCVYIPNGAANIFVNILNKIDNSQCDHKDAV